MSYYDDSSLFVAPNGYKTSVLFAQKPMDANGQLAFTRSNDTATRVGPDGLIEKVRTNLLLQSQTFDNASWVKLNSATVTANTTIAPDGTLTADTLSLAAAANSSIFQATSTISQLTFSVFVKVASGTKDFRLRFDAPAATTSANFTATTTWQRFTFTATTTGIGGVYIINDSIGTAGDLIIWAAQVETGDIATDYIPTTTTAVSVGPVANLPRIDYTGGGCGKLLLEPQRTNLMLNSERIGSWLSLAASATSNTAVSPSGYADADTATATGNAPHLIYQNLAFTSGTAYTLSVFAKANTSDYIQLVLAGQFSATNYANFDLSNGTITANAVSTAKIENYGNGWYRCSVSATAPVSALNSQIVYLINSPTAPRAQSFSASGESVYLWGGQFEAGAYVTSYIPTLAAAVTKGADNAIKTGISSLIGQTEGTLFADFEFNGNSDINGNIPINIYTVNSEAYIFISNAGILFLDIVVAGVLSARISGVIGAVGRKKIAFAYKANDFVGYMNGIQIGTDTSGSIGAMGSLSVGAYKTTGYSTTGGVNQALLFKTRLSNSELASLTTL